jgi:hypothetical protein
MRWSASKDAFASNLAAATEQLERLRGLMNIAEAVLGFHVTNPMIWSADWAWGLPLIVLTVVLHVFGLGLIGKAALGSSGPLLHRRYPIAGFAAVVGSTALLATCLHAIEAGIWAAAYRLLGALPGQRSAMLYSLNALTSYGHASVSLKDEWELLGALEALNGWLLFGLSTAFLFGIIAKVWALEKAP